ncbi:MAG: glycoside hydrolase family 95 protein, partial [Bacteroidota bacterium]|nr:glycoside hydrolase family 95 protein [Bacteroidota bacterium]
MDKSFLRVLICTGFLLPALFSSCSKEEPVPAGPEVALWYNEPAENWNEALPIGNGRLGAMVFGRTDVERIQLNEESVWSRKGGYEDSDGNVALPVVRNLLFDGKYREAQELVVEELMQERLPTGTNAYQTLGDINITYEDSSAVTNYRRTLKLDSALARVDYTRGGVDYHRQIFSSSADNVIVFKEKAGKGGKIDCTITLS